ncbi:hypothetical protein BDW74DRAFT_44082 [Aspergillus multicolor]|uniref:Zn(II)2Cys6 transcription factor domain-containing protein n=1 Tax=Aspergillus multicolor TaxID=41759 RepID=UPI003CCDD5F3
MLRQPQLRPKSYIAGYPDAIYGFSTVPSLSQFDSRISLGEEKQDQRVFRVKRKHVLKACDHCRVKKTKCDGKQPCSRCSSYNRPCLFRERKATQTKVYSRGFVEMLESNHALVVKALQRLYKLCASKEGFPGEPLVETPDGYPLTHAILDRLGLIKQAEESSHEVTSDETEDLHYLHVLSSSTDCSATTDPSPEPVTPPDPIPTSLTSPVHLSPIDQAPTKWEFQSLQPIQPEPYHGYPQTEFRGAMPSTVMEIPALISEPKCATTVPSPVPPLAHPYLYCCTPEPTGNRLQPIVNTGSSALPSVLPAVTGVTTAGLSVGLVDNYNLHIPDHQPMYQPPLQPAWAYSCE